MVDILHVGFAGGWERTAIIDKTAATKFFQNSATRSPEPGAMKRNTERVSSEPCLRADQGFPSPISSDGNRMSFKI